MLPANQNSTADSAPDAVLTVKNLGKVYGAPVLQDISLTLRAGEVTALAGENGAGKSTLSKIIGGLVAPTMGQMHFQGKRYEPRSRTAAEKLGVRMVLQELNLIPTLTVAENIFLGRWPHNGSWIRARRLRHDAQLIMKLVGLEGIDPDTPAGWLGIGHQQMVEIGRNLVGDCRVLILDEPTAMLTPRETDLLFRQIERLRYLNVAILYITHRLEELARIAQQVIVLRDGQLVCAGEMKYFTPPKLVQMMVGRRVDEPTRPTLVSSSREPALRVAALSRAGAVNGVSFEVARGEIFGIAGLVGSGRTELLRLIYGADHADSGEIAVGSPLRVVSIRSPKEAVRHGIVLISEDRKEQGLIMPWSIAQNISLGSRNASARGAWIDTESEARLAERHITGLHIKCRGPHQVVHELSGGNQQKVVIARWLDRDAAVMLIDEPTRGIDVGAKFEIYQLLTAMAREGRAVVVVSSDLRELMGFCDRIGVMSAGRLVETFNRGQWTQDVLLEAAFSGFATAVPA